MILLVVLWVAWLFVMFAPVMPKRASIFDWYAHKLLTWFLCRRFKDEQDRLAFYQFMQLPKRERYALYKLMKRNTQDHAVYLSTMSPDEREAFSMWSARLHHNGWKPPVDRVE